VRRVLRVPVYCVPQGTGTQGTGTQGTGTQGTGTQGIGTLETKGPTRWCGLKWEEACHCGIGGKSA